MGAAHARRSATSLRRADTAERQHGEKDDRQAGERVPLQGVTLVLLDADVGRGHSRRRPSGALECCSITMGCSGSPVSFSNAGRSMFWRTFPGASGPNSSACAIRASARPSTRTSPLGAAICGSTSRDLPAGTQPVHQHVRSVQAQRRYHLVAGPSVPQLVVEVDGALVDEAASGCDVLHDVASRIDRLRRNFERRPLESPIELCAERALVRAACLPVAERDAGRARRRGGDERPCARAERVS